MMQGTIAVGHPVDVASGAQFTAWHDAEIKGIVPLVWRRYYSTKLLDRPPSTCGWGWIHPFCMALRRDLDGYTLTGDRGQEIHFNDPSGLVDGGGSVYNFGHFMELRFEGQVYVVYHWHDWRAEVEKFIFDPRQHDSGRMRLQAVGTNAGHSLLIRYDEASRPTSITQSVEGRTLHLSYNDNSLLARLELSSPISERETRATYEYDDRHRLIAVYDVEGSAMRYAYDGEGRLTGETGRTGGAYSMSYDREGRCVETSGADGYRLRKLAYDSLARVTQVTDSTGAITTYQLNEIGQVISKISASGAQEATQFDAQGRIAARIGPSGEIIKISYTDRGDIETITTPNGGVTNFQYGNRHRIESIQVPDGGVWRWEYTNDAISALTDPVGARTEVRRDSANLVTEIRTSAGNIVSVRRDTGWSREEYWDTRGLLISYRFDHMLNTIEIRDSMGVQHSLEYDNRGFLKAVNSGDGSRRELVCNALGSVTWSRTENGHVSSYDYTAYSHRRRFIAPGDLVYEYEWDSEGRLIRVTNPKGEASAYTYDSAGNIATAEFFDGRVEHYTYDESNRRTSRQKADGNTLKFAYDSEGNFLGASDATGELSSNKYDLIGRLLETRTAGVVATFEYDLVGRAIAETQDGQRVESVYHPFGSLAARRVPDSPLSALLFKFDTRRRLTSIQDETKAFAEYEYDNANLLLSRRLGSVSEQFEYDTRRRLRVQRATGMRGRITSILRTFEYDRENNLARLSDSTRGQTTYAYDSSAQLINSTDSRRGTVEYQYDSCGNLIRKGANTVLVYDKGNRLRLNGGTHYQRDANGNLISATTNGEVTRYSWNAFDQLTGVTLPDGTEVAYGYDGIARRVFREINGVRTSYLWAGRDLVREQSGRTVRTFLFGRFVPEALWDNASVRVVIRSNQTRPSELTDDRGVTVWTGDFDDWGLPLPTEGSDRPALGLPGQYWDASIQLYYNHYRYYSPKDGQFLSPDPIGYLGGLNEYRFGPNPISWIDPLGLRCGETHMKVVINDDLEGQGGGPDPTRADWYAKQDAFNAGVEAAQEAGTPLTIPTPSQYAVDRQVGNSEAAAARVAQGMGAGVQADHPVDLRAGGGQGQALVPLVSGVNGSVGSQVGRQAGQLPAGAPTPMFDLHDSNGNLVRQG